MTSLVSWAGVDSRGPSSIYIATDSRISWGKGSTWDAGRKVFASRRRLEIFGYVGDVLFPSLVLGQIADAPEGPRTAEAPPAEVRFERIAGLLKSAFESLPTSERRPFRIAYAQRLGESMLAKFQFLSLSWNQADGWVSGTMEIPRESDSVAIWGSGAKSVELWKERWNRSSQARTSRAIFSAFCDAIQSGSDPLSGGPPQLVGIYRTGPAQTIGIVHDGQPYVFGLPANPRDYAEADMRWHNHLFERCDANGDLLKMAQPHHSPRGLGRGLRE